jgi:hypothetical protein
VVELRCMIEAAKLMTLARYLARKRVKEHLQAKGFRIQNFEPLAISVATKAYLDRHLGELIAEAKLRLCKSYISCTTAEGLI